MMLERSTIAEIAHGKELAFCQGRCWLYASLGVHSHAYSLWGVPEESDIQSLIGLFESSYGKMKPHAIVADVTELEFVNPAPFACFYQHFRERKKELSEMVTDACIALMDTIGGSVAAGFFGIVQTPFPFVTRKSLSEGFSALGYEALAFTAYVRAKGEAMHQRDLIQMFRLAVMADTSAPALSRIAKTLAMSERTLQRKLREQDTSFSVELTSARIEHAKIALTTTKKSVLEVALELGFRTPEHFATSFREYAGVTPSVYRKNAASK